MSVPTEVYNQFETVVPSDTVNFVKKPDAIFVGVAGDIIAVMDNDATVKFKAVAIGVLRISPKRINSTNTTATDMVALRQV